MTAFEDKAAQDILNLIHHAKTAAGKQKYYNDMVQYLKPTQVTSDCAEILFYNMGATTMYVNGIDFAPGTGISFDGKENELDTTKYSLTFIGAGISKAFVVRKCYVI